MSKLKFEYNIRGYRYAPESFHIYKGLPGQKKKEIPLSDEQRQQMGYLCLTEGVKSAVDYVKHIERERERKCRQYPQAYAAAATMLHTLMDDPKAVVLDIGGFTADYLLLKNGKADLTSCDSLENGVILLYNKIRSRGNSELDLLLDESDVDAILAGRKTSYPAEAVRLVERLAQEFVNDLFSTLRERMLDLRYSKVVFVGGGAILLRRQIEASGKVGTPLFVTNINANAAGFEYLYRLETAGR